MRAVRLCESGNSYDKRCRPLSSDSEGGAGNQRKGSRGAVYFEVRSGVVAIVEDQNLSRGIDQSLTEIVRNRN